MYATELAFGKELAYEAGDVMRKYQSPTVSTNTKADASPVTIADTEINQLVLDRVAQRFPQHGVLGEEASNHNGEEFVWVCDPIDGTIAYINHIPTSMFSLALVRDGKPVVGVAYNPWTDELYAASEANGTFCNDKSVHVSSKDFGGGATIGASGNLGTPKMANEHVRLIEAIDGQAHVVNVLSVVFKGCLIAAGYIEGRVFVHPGAHDIAAVKIIIEEAGGKCTDLQGNEQRYDQPINGAILSNGVIHDKLITVYENSRN